MTLTLNTFGYFNKYKSGIKSFPNYPQLELIIIYTENNIEGEGELPTNVIIQ